MAVTTTMVGCQGQSSDSADDAQTTQATEAADTTTAANDSNSEEVGTYEDGSHPKFSGQKVRLTIKGEEAIIAM